MYLPSYTGCTLPSVMSTMALVRLNGADVDGPDIAVTRPTLSVALAKVQSEMHFQFTANVV